MDPGELAYVVDAIHPQSNKFAAGVKIKDTGKSKPIDSLVITENRVNKVFM